MKEFSGSFVYSGNGGFSLQPQWVAEALIRMGVKSGVDAALNGLSSFFATGNTTSSEIIILGRITVQERTTFGRRLPFAIGQFTAFALSPPGSKRQLNNVLP